MESAEANGFDVLVTADRNLRYQQNLIHRKLAIVVLPSGQWPALRPHVAVIAASIDAAIPGSYQEVQSA